MYKSFQSMAELFAYVSEDKACSGAEAAMRNRFPVRFVLFDNFADFNKFIVERPTNIYQFPIDNLTTKEYPDLFPTSTELGNSIKEQVSHLPANDYVVFPFSEMCRFYPSEEFVALVKTIKGFEAPEEAQTRHMRIYIPIVGMQGKMSPFMNDPQAYVWEYKTPTETRSYRLILTQGSTYDVLELENNYTVVHNLRQWLWLWKQGKNLRRDIICTSHNIYLNARNAQPDNAFSYELCDNAYEFLTKGLGLDFGNMPLRVSELPMWEQLSVLIDIENFDLTNFVNERFDTYAIHDNTDFIKSWLECDSDFDRWLLALYFRMISDENGYICEVLNRCDALITSELFSVIATAPFDGLDSDEFIRCRREALNIAAATHDVKITATAEQKLYEKLSTLLNGSEDDRNKAIQLMTDFTDSDKRLAIEAYGKGLITYQQIENIYPDFYHYLDPMRVQLPIDNNWIADYFDVYRKAKAKGNIQDVQAMLHQRNASQTCFYEWFNDFKSVDTCLYQRTDIEKYYWIDGLGTDWLPFIAHIIASHRSEHVYLNEVFIARAKLPTTTSVNKPILEKTAGTTIDKTGDLDTFAHQNKNPYPQYLIDEMHIVQNAVDKILQEYNGQKIAIISDHGMSYMPQYGKGLSIAGIESEHDGRVARKLDGTAIADNKYVVLEDGKTLCALTEDSLTAKTPKGHGAHGGATPEEVLVPIIIVSNQENASNYTSELKNDELTATNPVLSIKIKGLASIDVPYIEYNNVKYSLTNNSSDNFVSEKLNLVDTATTVTLRIGTYQKIFHIKISTGAQEDDLFKDL